MTITVGLFGQDAPVSVRIFGDLAGGALRATCAPSDDEEAITERAQLARRSAYRACLGGEAEPVTYAYSQVWRILRGRRVDAGQVQGKFAMRTAPTAPADESSRLSHDAPGLLSVRRGGGVFDFGLTAAPSPEFDADYIVIGRVVDGLDSLATLATLPVVKAADGFGQGEGSSASRAKACSYGSTNTYCSQNKPLKKVTLRSIQKLAK